MLSWQHQTSYTGFPRPRAVRSGSENSVRRFRRGSEVSSSGTLQSLKGRSHTWIGCFRLISELPFNVTMPCEILIVMRIEQCNVIYLVGTSVGTVN